MCSIAVERLTAWVVLTQACGFAQVPTNPKAFFSLQAPDQISASVVDAAGNVYITGYAFSGEIPVTAGAFQTIAGLCSPPCQHAFVAKFSADGTRLLYSTYLRGSGRDLAQTIAVDSSGSVYVAGTTTSLDFPVTAGAYQTAPGAGFITRLSADGTKVLASTYLAGAQPWKLALDTSGNVFIAGATVGNTYTTTPGAFATVLAKFDDQADAFVMKMDSALEAPIYAARFGGDSEDIAYSVIVDASGNAYVAGTTESTAEAVNRFPITVYAYSNLSPAPEAFVTKLSPDGSRVMFSSVFGEADTGALDMALDAGGAVYVAGFSLGLPPYISSFLTQGNGFAAKLSGDRGELIYATQLPMLRSAVGVELPLYRIEIVDTDHLAVRGWDNAGAPTTPGVPLPCAGSTPRGYLVELNSAGTGFLYATYLNNDVALSSSTIWSASQDPARLLDPVPLTQPGSAGINCVANSATFSSDPIAPGEIVTLFGVGIGPAEPALTQLDSSGDVSVILGGVSVYFNGIAAPLLYVSSSQINAVVPFEIAGWSSSSVRIIKDGSILPPDVNVAVAAADPAIYNVGNTPAIVNPDGTLNSVSHPAAAGSAVTIYMTGAGLMTPLPATGSIGQGPRKLRFQ